MEKLPADLQSFNLQTDISKNDCASDRLYKKHSIDSCYITLISLHYNFKLIISHIADESQPNVKPRSGI